jgi:RimJ/RimL family protein N-acetyltransferase
MRMPPLTTERLLIREFVAGDLDAVHRLLDVELAGAATGAEGVLTLAARRRWLDWTVLNYEQLAYLRQPPYGDRAVALRSTDEIVGACGLVPCLAPFEQIPDLRRSLAAPQSVAAGPTAFTPEVGLYWAVAPAHRGRGYATEAAAALIAYAFATLRLSRIVATTSHDNAASIGVMRKLGMRLTRNPFPEPLWLQTVGALDNPAVIVLTDYRTVQRVWAQRGRG